MHGTRCAYVQSIGETLSQRTAYVDTAMATLSNAAVRVLTALADDDQAVVITIRHDRGVKVSVWVKTRGDAADTAGRFYVLRATFHMLHRAGLLVKARDWQALGQTYTEYELTDAGRAALESS